MDNSDFEKWRAHDYMSTQAKLRSNSNIGKKINAIHVDLQEQLDLAKQEAADAKKDARFSKIIATISIVLSLVSIIGQFIT